MASRPEASDDSPAGVPADPEEAPSDWAGVLVSALTLVLVLIISYMCLLLFKSGHGVEGAESSEGFRGWSQYRPTCSDEWLADRRGHCKGLTTGDMPSIEEDTPISWQPCAGALGVPPPAFP